MKCVYKSISLTQVTWYRYLTIVNRQNSINDSYTNGSLIFWSKLLHSPKRTLPKLSGISSARTCTAALQPLFFFHISLYLNSMTLFSCPQHLQAFVKSFVVSNMYIWIYFITRVQNSNFPVWIFVQHPSDDNHKYSVILYIKHYKNMY